MCRISRIDNLCRLRLRNGGLGLGRAREGIRSGGSATSFSTALTPSATVMLTTAPTTAARVALGTLLSHQLLQLPLLEHLAECAHCEAEHSNG